MYPQRDELKRESKSAKGVQFNGNGTLLHEIDIAGSLDI
jgi:hypothetical protein